MLHLVYIQGLFCSQSTLSPFPRYLRGFLDGGLDVDRSVRVVSGIVLTLSGHKVRDCLSIGLESYNGFVYNSPYFVQLLLNILKW